MSLNLLKQFYDMAVKTDKYDFTKDLALLVDIMRGLLYRDFGIKHPAQSLSDKMVILKVNKDGSQSAKIDYTGIINGAKKTGKPLSKEVKEELKDFYVANLSQKDMWVGDLLENESKKVFTEWKKRKQKLN